MNIVHAFLEQARIRPQAPALIATRGGRDRTVTFAQLAAASAATASQFSRAGLRPGDAVLLLIPMSPELYAVLVGLFRAGLVAVVLDPSAGRDHIDRCVRLCPPAGFIGIPRAHALRAVSAGIRAIPRKFCVGAGWPFGSRLNPWERPDATGAVLEMETEAPAPAGPVPAKIRREV